jgi:outer membrane protease
MLWFHTHKTKRNRSASSFAFAVAEQVSDAEVTASSFAFAAAVAAVDLVAEEKVCSSCSYQTEVNWHMAAGMVLCGQMKEHAWHK